MEATGVFLAIGHTPNTAFLKDQLQMTPKEYIIWTVPFRTYTSVEGVLRPETSPTTTIVRLSPLPATGCMAALDAERWLCSAAKGCIAATTIVLLRLVMIDKLSVQQARQSENMVACASRDGSVHGVIPRGASVLSSLTMARPWPIFKSWPMAR